MYQIPLRNSKVFQPIVPQAIPATQTYVSQVPQVVPQVQVPQVSMVPQVAMAPQVQPAVPVQSLYPTQTSYASYIPQIQTQATTVPQVPQVVPYVQPIGSRFPYIQNHLGQIPNQANFNNIGGSIYGRVSMIK